VIMNTIPTLRAIIVDDEVKACENLGHLIKQYTQHVQVLGSANNILKAKKLIEEHQPELVFLDVEMGTESGFELLSHLENDPAVIFVTAHEEYAIRALRMSAVDYLLKPIDPDDLNEAVNNARQRHQRNIHENERLRMLSESLDENDLDTIVLPAMDKMSFVKIKDIIRCESLENYTRFYIKNGDKILISKSIKYYDELLESFAFFRVHRSHLINLRFIKEYLKGEGGYVKLIDGTTIPVSRRKKNEFLRIFEKLM
jgi:two-component system LytT family response regulator